jgi:SNF2 family DNA or RNA helicase
MGHGKSLTCLAVILATLHHICTPRPSEPGEEPPQVLTDDQGRRYYWETSASPDRRESRSEPERKKLYLSDATLIICPSSLISQWTESIEEHIAKRDLIVYEVDPKKPLELDIMRTSNVSLSIDGA